MARKISLLIPFLLLLLSSCNFKELEFVGLTKLESESVGLTESTLNLTFKVKNPNWYGYRLKNSNFKIEVGGGSFDLLGDQKWKIKSGDNYLNAQVKFNTLFNLGALAKLALGKTQVADLNIVVKGTTDAKLLFIKKTIYIDEKVPINDVFE